jgi:hypothetical protein
MLAVSIEINDAPPAEGGGRARFRTWRDALAALLRCDGVVSVSLVAISICANLTPPGLPRHCLLR